jgi:antagonist of KipI
MTLIVESPSMMMTVQDLGRNGYQRYGLPESGPMDWWAFRAANILVGNGLDSACLEMGFSDAAVKVEADALMALCGAGYRLRVNRKDLPLWMAFRVRKGDVLNMEKIEGGNWAYLAVSGGILSPEWLGSRSAYPRAGLGRRLVTGVQLPLSSAADEKLGLAGRTISEGARPSYGDPIELSVILGPHQNRITRASLETFNSAVYRLSAQSDRMGYRLKGPALEHSRGTDIVSQGMALGEIQVPADGQPIVMMPDHPTTGGYTCIGTVVRVDLPLLAQAQPEKTGIHFTPVDILQAQGAFREAVEGLEAAVSQKEDLWLDLWKLI